MPTYLITAATGNQGSSAVHQLLASGHTVHAFVRDPASASAQRLAIAGAKLFPGTFSSIPAITAAAQGCDGVFILSPTSYSSLTEEFDLAQNIITASLAAGVTHAITSTVCGLTPPEDRGLARDNFFGAYFANKIDIENAVKSAGFETWTLLRPAGFMGNFLLPAGKFMAPELSQTGELWTALSPEIKCPLVDPADVGKMVKKAFEEPKRFGGQVVEVVAEHVTMREYLAAMSRVAGKKAEMKYWSRDDVDKIEGKNPVAVMSLNVNEYGQSADIKRARGWGVEMTGVEEYFRNNREKAIKSIGPA